MAVLAGGVSKLRYTTGNKLACTGLYTRQARISWSTRPFGIYDSFHESPTPSQHTSDHTLPV